ncbi:sugar phosphate isomerase/epimerase family protein [Elioraea rosea]|uniref:sugar phosphate isomerase/epimerase family protein n=1 Tax=Elioraea rosea TaxID=2492390 RepID=UPI0011836CB1|nr:sugar phosphate isomerase/epimerase family protein [Elioraea rosea]
MTTFKDRIGIDFGARLPIEEAIAWSASHGVSVIDVRLGDTGNAFGDFDARRIGAVRASLEARGIHLGLHTLSAVNVAETAPFLSEAVEEYFRRYIELARPIGAGWIVLHGGFHFTGDYDRRMEAGIQRLQRLGDHARANGIRLLLENMNPEPADAEVRYLACDVEECRAYFDRLDPEIYGWTYTVNHAHMLPIGIRGFFEAFGPGRMEEVRLADNRGGKEEHLRPGEGTIDFEDTFAMIEKAGYRGHYMLAFGTIDDMREGRDSLADRAVRAGIAQA